MERVKPTATEVVEQQLMNVDLPLDGQDLSAYAQPVSREVREKVLIIAYAFAPPGVEHPGDGPVPAEVQRIIRNKAVAGSFSTFEVGVKMYAVVADLPIPFVRELLTFLAEAEHKEP